MGGLNRVGITCVGKSGNCPKPSGLQFSPITIVIIAILIVGACCLGCWFCNRSAPRLAPARELRLPIVATQETSLQAQYQQSMPQMSREEQQRMREERANAAQQRTTGGQIQSGLISGQVVRE